MTTATQDADWLDQPTILNADASALVAEVDQIAAPVPPTVEQQAASADHPPALAVELAGVYDITEADYHKDPVPEGSLSASGAKLLMECPEKFAYRQQHGSEHRDYFDFGKAAHALVLGAGAPVAILPFEDFRTKDAKAARDEAYARGETPMLAATWQTVQAMADKIRQHPIASALLNPERGKPEQTLIWHDRIWRRALVDFMPNLDTDGRLIVTDYKTCADASAQAFSRSAASYGYHQQDAWYLDGVRAVSGRTDVAFVFIAQEKEAPYVVNVIELTDSFRRIGAWRNEIAVDRYIAGMASGRWPAYSTEVERVDAPRWTEIEHEEQRELHNEGVFQ